MRCPSCEKFVSLETEVDDSPQLEVEAETDTEAGRSTFRVHGEVRVVRKCADCGEEMKELTFDVDHEHEVNEVLTDEEIATTEVADTNLEESESGGGRYKKNMVGFSGTVTIEYGKKPNVKAIDIELSDSASASSYEEMC